MFSRFAKNYGHLTVCTTWDCFGLARGLSVTEVEMTILSGKTESVAVFTAFINGSRLGYIATWPGRPPFVAVLGVIAHHDVRIMQIDASASRLCGLQMRDSFRIL